MNTKRSTELFNQKTMSTAGTDGPFVPQQQLARDREKLILPTINTSRKLQIVDVLSFANMAVSNNNAHSNLLNLPLKQAENASINSRFGGGSSSLVSGIKRGDSEQMKHEYENSIDGSGVNFKSNSTVANAIMKDS
jgi:hypothetical protein